MNVESAAQPPRLWTHTLHTVPLSPKELVQLQNDRPQSPLKKKKMHRLKAESYVLFGQLSEDFKARRQDSQMTLMTALKK